MHNAFVRFCLLVLGCFLALLSFSWPTAARAAAIGPNAHLKIILEYSQGKKYEGKSRKDIAKEWLAVCKAVAAALRTGNTYHGYGAFKTFSCAINKSHLKGPKKPAEFELRLKDTVSGVSMSLIHAMFKNAESGSLEQWQQEALVNFSASDKTLKILQDRDFSNLVGFALLNSMPMQTKFESDGDKFLLKRAINPRWPLPSPPPALGILQLAYNHKTGSWTGVSLGDATLVASSAPAEIKGKDGKTILAHSYNIKKYSGMEKANPKIGSWMRVSGDRADNFKEVSDLVKKAADELIGGKSADAGDESDRSMLSGMVPGGYVGLRYGFSLFKTGLFVSKVRTFGLLVEARSGVLSGLRFYYELTPQVKESYLGETLYYRSSRGVVGWSFGINPEAFISRIDVVPKIGQWTFNVDIPITVEGSDEILIKKFKLDTALSMGIEAGIEFTVPWILIRTWAGFDQSVAALKSAGSQGTVSSRRFGLDGIIDGPAISTIFNIDFLAFVVQESVAITQSNTDKDDDGLAIKGISYTLRTAGLGLTASW